MIFETNVFDINMQTELIKKTIDKIANLSQQEWDLVNNLFIEKTLEKNDYLLKEGEVCNFIGYVNSGTLIYFRLTENGTEMTTDFAFAADWVTDNRSRLKSAPSFINIKAIEKTELLIISNQGLLDNFNRIPGLERVGRILTEQAFIKISQQSIDLQTMTATGRYDKMLHEYPEIFQKVPLFHIANYLGIAPKSLSRIRKQSLKR